MQFKMNVQDIQQKLKTIRDVTTEMVKNTMYLNFLRFEPHIFYNDLFDKCFENQEEFENIAYIMMRIENKKKEQINDMLKFIINASYSYANEDILQHKLTSSTVTCE